MSVTLGNYPRLSKSDIIDLGQALRNIIRIRADDQKAFASLFQQLVMGRTSNRIPANSADVVAADKEGDIVFTPTFIYYLVDNSGTLVWRRIAGASF